MTISTPQEVYPFASQDGMAIPLDIIKPSCLVIKSFSPSSSSFTIPENYKVCTLIASTACLLRFGEDFPTPLVDATLYENTLLVPQDTVVTASLLPETIYVRSLGEDIGTLYIQLIEKWAGLALDRQYARK